MTFFAEKMRQNRWFLTLFTCFIMILGRYDFQVVLVHAVCILYDPALFIQRVPNPRISIAKTQGIDCMTYIELFECEAYQVQQAEEAIVDALTMDVLMRGNMKVP